MSILPEFVELEQRIEEEVGQAAARLVDELQSRYGGNPSEAEGLLRSYEWEANRYACEAALAEALEPLRTQMEKLSPLDEQWEIIREEERAAESEIRGRFEGRYQALTTAERRQEALERIAHALRTGDGGWPYYDWLKQHGCLPTVAQDCTFIWNEKEKAALQSEWISLCERALDDSKLPLPVSEAARFNSERTSREGNYERIVQFIADMCDCPTERVYRNASTCDAKALQPGVRIVERDVAWPPRGRSAGMDMRTMVSDGPPHLPQMAGWPHIDRAAWEPKADVVLLDAAVLTGGVLGHPVAGCILGRALVSGLGEERCRAWSPSALNRDAVARTFLLPYPKTHFAKVCRWCGREFDTLRYEGFPTFCGRCLAYGYSCLGGTFSLLDFALEGAESDLRYWIENHGMVSASGQNGRVPDAASIVLKHRAPPSRAKPQLESNLRAYAEALGFVPPAALSDERVYAQLDALSGTARDELFAGVIAVTDTSAYKREYGSWFKALVASGVLAGAERPGVYGTTCLASDGHQCRSIAEKTIDDWLTAHGLSHTREPGYPKVPGMESAYLADWRVGDNFVEYLGLQGKPDYDAKIRAKRELLQRTGIEVIWLHPKDLLNLDKVLGRLFASSVGHSLPRESGDL